MPLRSLWVYPLSSAKYTHPALKSQKYFYPLNIGDIRYTKTSTITSITVKNVSTVPEQPMNLLQHIDTSTPIIGKRTVPFFHLDGHIYIYIYIYIYINRKLLH